MKYFSLIVPAHNEERYIAKTLEKIVALDYPKEKYEVLVVENASTDNTYQEAKRFEGQNKANLRVFSAPVKGVSAAKNFGIDRLATQSDWVVFLDADTLLEASFLKNLSAFLADEKNQRKNYSVGTTQVMPLSPKFVARFWFAIYDFGHRVTRTSYAIQIFRRPLLGQLRFDEKMVLGEDLKLIGQALDYGRFFYFPTTEVYTSTRRFEQEGWLKVFFHWTFVAALPPKLQRRFGYKVVR